jgi:hypothetical protein
MVRETVKTAEISIVRKWSQRLLCVAFALAMSVGARISRGSPVDPQKIGSLIEQLASADPAVRQVAEQELMDLKRSDLPALREVALSQRPLGPGQVVTLHEVVTQVFLASEPLSVDPEQAGFLGVRFSPQEQLQKSDGILVLDRISGFPAYQYLQGGDLIVKFLDWPAIAIHSADDIIRTVNWLDPGDKVRLGIVRHGHYMMVAIPLDFRPLELVGLTTEGQISAWVDARQAKADEFWDSEFSALSPTVQSVSMASKANSEERSKSEQQ